jgi:hypothetical protein
VGRASTPAGGPGRPPYEQFLMVDLCGIDAPELGQLDGDRARKSLKNVIQKSRDGGMPS